jgi:hypothetical protein
MPGHHDAGVAVADKDRIVQLLIVEDPEHVR